MSSEFATLLKLAESIGFTDQTIDQLVDPTRRLGRHFPADCPVRLQLFSFPAANAMVGEPWLNWHEHYELILPLAGRGVFRNGDQQVDFVPGDLLVVDHNKLHGMVSLEGDHRSLVIHFLPELITGNLANDFNSVFLWPFQRRPLATLPIVKGESQEGREILGAAAELLDDGFSNESLRSDPVHQARTRLHLLRILEATRSHLGLSSDSVRHEFVREKHQKQINEAVDYLQSHLSEKVRLAEVARHVGMSLSHFKATFREVAGMTFSAALTRVRIGEAARLLRETNLSIAEISHRVGFSDQSHLVRRFRGIMEQTPSQYRRRFRSDPPLTATHI